MRETTGVTPLIQNHTSIDSFKYLFRYLIDVYGLVLIDVYGLVLI